MNEDKNGKASLTQRLDELNDEYYKRFWQLDQNREALAPVIKYMEEALSKQYARDYELLMGEYGIVTDKQIEELKIKRDKVLGEITLRYEKQAAVLARAKDKLDKENALAAAVANAEHIMKLTQVVPNDLQKRWWQRYARPNYAKVLAMREVDIEVQEYLGEKANSIEELENRPAAIIDLLKAKIECPRGRRARKRWEKEITATAAILERKFRQREEAQKQLDELIRAADEATSGQMFDEPRSCEVIQEIESVRVEEISEAKPTKAKRKRPRRIPPQQESEAMQGGQLEGQIGMEELKQNEEQAPENADKPEEGEE